MKTLKLLTIITAILLALGCTDQAKVEKVIPVGTFVSSTETHTTWNSIVVTTKGTFTVRGVVSALFNEPVNIDVYSNGNRYLCVKSAPKCQRIL